MAVDLLVPTAQDQHALAEHLQEIGYAHEVRDGVLSIADPSGNLLRLSAPAL